MIIDWIACSIAKEPSAFLAWLKSSLNGRWEARDYAPGKHTQTQTYGGVMVYTGAPYDDSIRLIVSGQGCRELEQAGLVSDWPEFLSKMLDAGARFTRLDVALDDKSNLLDMDTITACCKEGLLTSRWKHINRTEASDTAGELKGKTVTFGIRGSDTYLRIYDKGLKEHVSSHWIRVELEAHDKRAQALAKDIVKDGAGVVPQVILSSLCFKGRGSTERKDRWPTAPWWTTFLKTDRGFHLTVAPRDDSADKSYRWLLRSVAPTFARLYDKMGQALVEELLKQGRRCNCGSAPSGPLVKTLIVTAQ